MTGSENVEGVAAPLNVIIAPSFAKAVLKGGSSSNLMIALDVIIDAMFAELMKRREEVDVLLL